MDLQRIRSEFNQASQSFTHVELYPTASGTIYVKAALQPTFRQYYIVSIYFPDNYPITMPSVYVEKPKIDSAPHMYKKGNICYLHPTMWNPGTQNLEFVIKRATKWLGKYEVWKTSGKWPGAGIDH